MAKAIKNLKLKIKNFKRNISPKPFSKRFLKKTWRTLQKQLNKQSPQIKKFIRYTLYVILLLLLLAPLWPRTSFRQATWEVGKWPKDARLHLALAEEYAKIHNFDLVEKEVSLAKSLNPVSVFDRQAYLEKIFAEKIKKQNLEKEIRDWEEVLKEYPGFRDVYLRLSLLYWQINDDLMADVYLKKASHLSPNFPTTLQLHQFFQKNR